MTRTSRLALALAVALVPTLGAHAAPATPEGTDKLKAVFARYLGQAAPGEPNGVTVTPEGIGYRASFDVKPMMRPLQSLGVSVESAVSTLLLIPNDDGTWQVSSDALPPMTLHVNDQTVVMRSSSYAFKGLFDPKLAGFASAGVTQEGSTYDQEAPTVSQHRRTGRTEATQASAPMGDETVSLDLHYAVRDVTDAMTIKPPQPKASVAVSPSAPPMAFSYTLLAATTDLSATRLPTKGLLDLWAFLVAHPDRDSLGAAQDELRTRLRAVLPLFAGLKQSGAADDVALTTQAGVFSARKLAGSFALDGLAASGTMALALSFDDLKVPSADLPAWSVGLLPVGLDIKPTLTGFHFDEAARAAVDSFDLKTPDGFSPVQRDRIGHLIWPGGGRLTLAPSRITSGLLDLRFDGEATLDANPAGRLNLTAIGLDRAIATLQQAAATDPTAAQILTQFVVAKNLAKPNPDGSLTWVVEASPAAPPTVNGVPLK